MALLNIFKKSSKKQTPKAPKRGTQPDTDRYPAQKVADVKDEEKKEESKVDEAPKAVVLKESRVAWRILREPHVTEKSTNLTSFNQYVFKVIGNPSKPEVKKAIEETHGVHVKKVAKISLPGKKRRRGKHIGWKSGYKKAIVTLRKGESIEVLPH